MTTVETSAGPIEVEQVVVAVGPWIASLWEMLGLPARLDVHQPDGSVARDVPMWTYWYLQEGELEVDPATFVTDDGRPCPVLHVDSDQELRDDDGKLVTSEPWGIYVKPDRHSIQGGAAPLTVGPEFTVDPYPTGSVEPGFPDLWCAALSHCLGRFEGTRAEVRAGPLGRRRRVHRRQLPRLRPHEAERLRGRRLQPRLQDDRRRARDRACPRRRALRRCCTRSATSASRPATCTR